MPRHDYVRQKIIVCAEIYGRLLAELPSRSTVSSAASSRVRRPLGVRHLRTVTSQRPYGGNVIVKMANCGSDVEFKNEKYCAYDENNWRLTISLRLLNNYYYNNYLFTIYLRRFGALRPLWRHTSLR